MKATKWLLVVLTLLLLLPTLTGCAEEEKRFETLEDFEDAVLGVVTGSLYDGYSRELFPEARVDQYTIFPDLFQCVQQGKVDGFLMDEPNYNAVKRDTPNLKCLDVPQYDVEIGYGFQKNPEGNALQAEMNELLGNLREDGTLDELLDKWYGELEPADAPVEPDFSDNPTELRVAIDLGRKPFVYEKNGKPAGFEIEVLYLFCEEYGYKPTFENVPFASGIAGLSSEMYDLVAGGLYMTPARKESVNFSDPYLFADVVMVSLDGKAESSFLGGIKDGFRKTFIDEGRWKSILEGVGVTLLITVASAVIGTLFGFAVFMLCRVFGRVARGVTKVFAVLMNGTPIVVILMILYYVVFGKLDISSILVAILGFSLTTGTFFYEKLTVAVDGIDRGQTEGALAMGFTPMGAFFHIILPQAMKFFMPIYRGEMVSLVKATAIVGYIAVEDLTKKSDMIRSNTFEAFFPLISTALIYLLLSFGISQLIGLLQRRMEPKNRSPKKIMKGVRTQ